MNTQNDLLEGFVKGASEHGVPVDVVRGYLDYYQKIAIEAADWIKQAEEKSGDPEYKLKLAAEILSTATLTKKAFDWQGGLDKVLSGIGGAFGGNSDLGGTIAGGGGGALIGLLLANALGLDPMAGMLLSGLLGAGGGFLGNAYGSGSFGGPKGSPSTGAEPPAGEIQPQGEPSPDTDANGLQAGAPNPGEVVVPGVLQEKPYNMNVNNLQEVSRMQQAAPQGMQAPPPPPIKKPINLNPAGGPTPAGTPPPTPSTGAPKPPMPTVPQMNVGAGKPNSQGFVDPKITQGQKAQQAAVTRIN